MGGVPDHLTIAAPRARVCSPPGTVHAGRGSGSDPEVDLGSIAPAGEARREANRKFVVGISRAFGGAVFFSLPLLMTMEMWWLGFYMDRVRLLLLMLLMIPLLIGLDHYAGFEETTSWAQDAVDGIIAYGVGFFAGTFILFLFNVINASTPLDQAVGMVALQAVPAGFGAVIATAQLGGGSEEEERRRQGAGYPAEIFFMAAGAIFLAFNVAPTEEMMLIAFKMAPIHGLFLVAASLAMMHGFVYAVRFRGTPEVREDDPWWSLFLRFTLVGYAVALGISAYVLWTFGRFADGAQTLHLMETVVLGFPAALGAAAARLILSD